MQPANEPQWKREPFVFHKENGRYFGRGTTDDKGPALTAFFGARKAFEKKLPINISLTLLHALHTRWYETLKYVTDDEWNNRTVFHPEHKKTLRLWFLLGMYAWHCRHHVAHITSLREVKGW